MYDARAIGGGRTGLSTYELYLQTVPDGETPLTLAAWLANQAATGLARAEAEAAAAAADAGRIAAQDAAAAATTQAGVATTQAETSTSAASAAAGFRNQAEAARDASFVAVDVFPDIATGRTAVADGEQFAVAEAQDVVRYRRDSSSTQTEVARYPLAARVEKLHRLGSSLASSATIDLAAASGDFISITATEAITSLGTAGAGGVTRTVRAISTGLRFVHSNDFIRLPGGVDIVCGANDVLTFRTTNAGGTTWICTSYVRAQGLRQDIPEANGTASGLLSSANLARLRGLAEGEAALNAAANPGLLARLFQSTPESPSALLRIYVPIGQGLHVRIDHKRGSLSDSASDVGQVQENWEVDAVSARRVYAANNTSTINAGSWSTGTAFTAAGDWARVSTNTGAARTASFDGSVFRFSWLDGDGTAPIRLIVDGQFFEDLPAGSGTPRRRTITRAVTGEGAHTLRYQHMGTEGQPIHVVGVNVADAGGYAGGALNWGYDIAAGQEFLRTGVQNLVMRKNGALRMGGGHGGVVNAVAPQLIVDGIALNPDAYPLASPPNWFAAQRDILMLQAFDFEQPVNVADPSGPRYTFARVSSRFRYVYGGFDAELDVLIADPAGESLQEFYFAMLPLDAAFTHIRRPLAQALAGNTPFDPWSEIVEYIDPVTGASIEVSSRAALTAPGAADPGPFARLIAHGELFKHYGYGAGFGVTQTFARRQRITWSARFRP